MLFSKFVYQINDQYINQVYMLLVEYSANITEVMPATAICNQERDVGTAEVEVYEILSILL